MAYVVGSVSVEVVPDFKNAQNAITAWFKSQPDSLKVPVRPDLDDRSIANVEREAKQVGDKVGRAMADGAAVQRQKSLQRQVQDELRAQERILRDRQRMQVAAEQDEIRRRAQAETQRLRAEKQHIDGLVREWKRAQSQIEKDKIQVEIDRAQALRKGKEQGGLVVRAMRQEVHQNAGIIAAAIGGALLLGAPVVAGAAITLFGGLGAIAAAQSEDVRTAWLGAWKDIRNGAVEDARVLVPAYERMAANIADSFQEMRPEIRSAFEGSVEQVDAFSASVRTTTETVVPGFLNVVKTGMPTVLGFGNLLEETGVGLDHFFDILAANSTTSGRVFDLLGDSMQEILPLIGQLAVDGAQVATNVLPVLSTGLRGLNVAAELLGDSLPALLTGFVAFRASQGAGRMMQNLSNQLGMASIKGGQFASQLGTAAAAAHTVSTALPIIGVAAGALAVGFAASEQQIQTWTDALIEGGAAAEQAREQAAAKSTDDFVAIGQWLGLVGTIEDAEQAMHDYEASLDPVTRAQHELDQASSELKRVLGDQDRTSGELADAQRDVAYWTDELASRQADLEIATRGVTEAMAEQVDQAFAAADSSFAYQKSLQDLAQAQDDFKKAVKEFGKGSDEADKALLKLNESMLKSIEAASKMATSELPASMEDSEKKIIGAQAALDEMNRLVEAGFKLPPDLKELKAQLEAIVGGADAAMLSQTQLATAFEQVGIAVETIPGTKSISIDDKDTTPKLLKKLEDLGFSVRELPDGDFEVTAVTDEANANLGNLAALLAGIDDTTAKPKVDLDTEDYEGSSRDVYQGLYYLDQYVAVPGADLYYDPLQKGWVDATGKLALLDSQRPTPVGNLVYDELVGGWRDSMGKIFELDAQTPTPVGDLNYNPFLNAWTDATGKVVYLDDMRPTPIAALDDEQARIDLVRLQTEINNLHGNTVTISAQLDSTIRGLINWGTGDGPGMAPGTGDGPGMRVPSGPAAVPMSVGIGDGPGIPVVVKGESSDFTAQMAAFEKYVDKKMMSGPALGSAPGWQAQWAAVHGAFPGATLNSSYRPGAITATGNRSYHSVGRAIDVTPSMDIFNWIARNYPNSRELIYSPAGYRQIWNGAPHMYSEPTRGDHWDHVHWALRNGGAINGIGGPRDDLNLARVSNGEHMLDARDVQLMGGQQAVYAFREALNKGIIGSGGRNSLRNLVSSSGGGDREVSRSVAGLVNHGTIHVTSEREMMRQAARRSREALAAIGV